MLVNAVIFSLNRPCQLHALLESWCRFASGPPPKVVYAYTTADFRRGYEICRAETKLYDSCWIPQVNFRLDTLAAVENAWHAERAAKDATEGRPPRPSYTMFVVDDIVVRRPINFELIDIRLQNNLDAACFSLRLSPKITHCYSHGGTPAPCPVEYDPKTGRFPWPNRGGDWGYPMATDAHVFRTLDLLPILRKHQWSNPNTMEVAMAGDPIDKPCMLCLPEHAIVNVPQNRVQNTFGNRHMEGRGLSAEALNDRYLAGDKIDIRPIVEAETTACHTEMEYRFVKRAVEE